MKCFRYPLNSVQFSTLQHRLLNKKVRTVEHTALTFGWTTQDGISPNAVIVSFLLQIQITVKIVFRLLFSLVFHDFCIPFGVTGRCWRLSPLNMCEGRVRLNEASAHSRALCEYLGGLVPCLRVPW